MANAETVRLTEVIARTTGLRYCSACMRSKPADGFVKRNSRWRCAACAALSRQLKGVRK